ncbi:unnamed protein product [Diplocarpon coronariae]
MPSFSPTFSLFPLHISHLAISPPPPDQDTSSIAAGVDVTSAPPASLRVDVLPSAERAREKDEEQKALLARPQLPVVPRCLPAMTRPESPAAVCQQEDEPEDEPENEPENEMQPSPTAQRDARSYPT